MMPIHFTKASLTHDHAVKQKAAVRQMRELNERIAQSKKYRTLTPTDRKTLLNEGYARDLVDNIVFMTERMSAQGLDGLQQMDQIVTGFTYAAFDPSLYASHLIAEHLVVMNGGRCAFCEAFLADTGSGQVTHFRPAWCVIEDEVLKRSPYYLQAYSLKNLLYTCKDCGETFKNDYFPVKGQRSADPEFENPLLIDPYSEQPRDFIRFNPLNAEAYAFDKVCAFYVASGNYSIADVEQLLWQSPGNIPEQLDAAGNSISIALINQQFITWKNNNPHYLSRGQITIDTLGLNRHTLVRARDAQLISLQAIFMQAAPSFAQLDRQAAMQKAMAWLKMQTNAVLQFFSLSLDALQTMLMELYPGGDQQTLGSPTAQDKNVAENIMTAAADVQTNHTPNYLMFRQQQKQKFPRWLTSSLIYFVLEKEMHVVNKRRLVCLAADDYLYGAENRDKCLFLPIQWEKHTKHIIKVRAKTHIWETCFQELADSRPLEIRSLFAHHEIWVEGEYPALTSR